MLTLIGEDRPGIVAAVTRSLFEQGLNLGEASMLRLGGNFTIMMMVSGVTDPTAVERSLAELKRQLGLCVHIDPMAGGLHRHIAPNLVVHVSGADRAGIVAQVTAALAENGFNILDLESDVVGSENKPVYLMNILGVADCPLEDLEQAVAGLRAQGIEVNISSIETMIA